MSRYWFINYREISDFVEKNYFHPGYILRGGRNIVFILEEFEDLEMKIRRFELLARLCLSILWRKNDPKLLSKGRKFRWRDIWGIGEARENFVI